MHAEFPNNPEVHQAILMDYYRNPRCSGPPGPGDLCARGTNPACGDTVTLAFQLSGDRIIRSRTCGAGCAVSQAAASLLAERLEGMTIHEALEVLQSLGRLLQGEAVDSEEEETRLQRLLALRLITSNPARVQCASVALKIASQLLLPMRLGQAGHSLESDGT